MPNLKHIASTKVPLIVVILLWVFFPIPMAVYLVGREIVIGVVRLARYW